jgi:hypothetical protein
MPCVFVLNRHLTRDADHAFKTFHHRMCNEFLLHEQSKNKPVEKKKSAIWKTNSLLGCEVSSHDKRQPSN